MPRTLASVALVAVLASGCDSDCADASRINGTYAMWHTVQNVGGEGAAAVSEGYPSYVTFINGWSKWKLKASTTAGSFNVDVTDVADEQGDYNDGDPTTQPFSGTLTVSETNCNVMSVLLEGEFSTTVNTTHTFSYASEYVFAGDHLAGTFTYTDSFSGTADDGSAVSGGLENAEGEISGTLQLDEFETGFGG
jgi:hypothetical protein